MSYNISLTVKAKQLPQLLVLSVIIRPRGNLMDAALQQVIEIIPGFDYLSIKDYLQEFSDYYEKEGKEIVFGRCQPVNLKVFTDYQDEIKKMKAKVV